MKIKNVSQQELKITVPAGKDILTSNVKPNQVMYCENITSVTKQIVIYERKKLIVVDKNIQKPDYVDHYKPYYESGTYFSQPKSNVIDIEEIFEDSELEDEELEAVSPEADFDFDEESQAEGETPVKKGRGRPRKPVSDKPVETEKKKRGRPMGSTKKTNN